MASKHRPDGDPVQMHSAGDYYPVVVAVIDEYSRDGNNLYKRRYEVSHGGECEWCFTPEGAEQAAREMHARITRGET